MIEILIQFVGEFLLQILGELLFELGLRSVSNPFNGGTSWGRVLRVPAYLIFGVVVGFISLLIFPNSFVRSSSLPGINLLLTPLLAGAVMAGLGRLLARSGRQVILLDTFVYGFIFAFGMAVIRFVYTT
jgi:hypothetical protein